VTRRVRLTQQAQADLLRLFDFIVEREMHRAAPDFALAERAIEAIHRGLGVLEHAAFTCRKAGTSPLVRELVIPFGHDGYVALFEIVDDATVVVGAIRHQREDDYH
jgi:plasmid stabilization system protein ParE